MKTPKSNPLKLPNKQLQEAIEKEIAPVKGKIPPLRTIAYTAIDVVKGDEEKIVEVMMAYVDTDGICYRAENPELNKLQHDILTPIIKWLEARFDISLEITDGLLPIEQSEETAARLRAYLQSLDEFRLACALALTQAAGSVLLAMAALEGECDVETTATAARLEEDFQLEKYGADEEALKRREMVIRDIQAAIEFLGLLSSEKL